ncbi:SHOCT domain-containing protein [Candidatus Cetobacterium colombiensis]|uniref:SHOCT domain-containing protein n=1 Tax=Candidatus Cetobacterium colombiensis TaxID=3073100 RepID=A0ABU4WFV9_9FUSO|nr:SHOCT domain-containing protein [Candidatus Cetobacterium colombiensis]MDX8337358.1 SHOCT domain-containing protein [Candidatus Cetobacterium colombiensis]
MGCLAILVLLVISGQISMESGGSTGLVVFIVGLLLIFLVEHFNEKKKKEEEGQKESKKKKSKENFINKFLSELESLDFNISDYLMDTSYSKALAIDSNSYKIAFYNINKVEIMDCKDIISVELVIDGNQVSITDGAVMGGAIFGGIGAILGGLAGGKKVIHSIAFKLTVNNYDNPVIIIKVYDQMIKELRNPEKLRDEPSKQITKMIDIWLGRFKIIQENNSKPLVVPKVESKNNENIKLLEELNNLKNKGILTEEEFQEKKKQILKQI